LHLAAGLIHREFACKRSLIYLTPYCCQRFLFDHAITLFAVGSLYPHCEISVKEFGNSLLYCSAAVTPAAPRPVMSHKAALFQPLVLLDPASSLPRFCIGAKPCCDLFVNLPDGIPCTCADRALSGKAYRARPLGLTYEGGYPNSRRGLSALHNVCEPQRAGRDYPYCVFRNSTIRLHDLIDIYFGNYLYLS
jgi:hypothetical protein